MKFLGFIAVFLSLIVSVVNGKNRFLVNLLDCDKKSLFFKLIF